MQANQKLAIKKAMKRISGNSIICIGLLALCLFGGQVASGHDYQDNMYPGRVVILAKPGQSISMTSLLPNLAFSQIKAYDGWQVSHVVKAYDAKNSLNKQATASMLNDLYIITFPDTIEVRAVLSQLYGNPLIRAAEPDFKNTLFEQPSDPLFPDQWYLKNTGQEFYAIKRDDSRCENDSLYLNTGVPGIDVNLQPVYDNPPADTVEVLVSITDTGIDYGHPDLADNIYHNPNEIPDNGIDDDHNGFIDDYRGWDFSGDTVNVFLTDGDNDATDSVGHGTHVSGLVAAIQNDIGIASYPGKIKVLPCKVFPNGVNSVTVASIIYSADMGARVINMSWGSPFESVILREAILYAQDKGCLAVAAAGNAGNTDRLYPSSYEETFTVAAHNAFGFLTYFTTYGPFVDIVAPGRDILSLRAAGTDMYAPCEAGVRIIDDKYILADGTSMAAPIVSGAAAMLLSFNPGLTVERLKDVLRQSADDMIDPFGDGDNLPGYDTLSGWGMLNAGNAYGLTLEPSVYMLHPAENDIISGPVTIDLGVTGGYNGFVDLYVGEGIAPDSWTLLHHVDALASGTEFYTWDSDGLNGYYSLKVISTYGEFSVDVRIVNGNLVSITKPGDGEEWRYLIPIEGNAYGVSFDSVRVMYRMDGEPMSRLLFSDTRMYFNEHVFDWQLSNLAEGYYTLTMTGYIDGLQYSDSVHLLIKSFMRAGFPYRLPGFLAVSPATADIDGDGRKEIVVGCYDGLYAFKDDGSILDGFPVLTNVDMRSVPAFDDIDGDGLLDIIMTGDAVLTCYNYRGEVLSGWPKVVQTDMTYISYPIPVLGEFATPGDSVITYMSKLGEVRAYRYNGESYFYSLNGLFTALDPNIFDTSQFVGNSIPFLTVSNLDQYGPSEVVAVYSTVQDESGIYIWNGRNGLPPYDWDTPLARKTLLSFGGSLADVDDDGALDIVMTGLDSNQVMTLWAAHNGNEDLPGWPVVLEGIDSWLGTSPVCADIDGDGDKEIVVTYFSLDIGRVYVFNHDGTPYVENPALPPGVLVTVSSTLGNMVVADVDGNGIPNLVCRGGGIFPGKFEQVYAWEPNGDLTPGYPITTPTPVGEVWSTPMTPLIDDLDNDGTTEMVLCGDANDLYVWNLESPFDALNNPWPRFLGNSKNTGINPRMGIPTDTDGEPVFLPNRLAIQRVYPNPFNPAATIQFSVDRSADITLTIYNILGQKVITLVDGYYAAGDYSVVWKGVDGAGAEVASGVYFARLAGDKASMTRKMVLVR